MHQASLGQRLPGRFKDLRLLGFVETDPPGQGGSIQHGSLQGVEGGQLLAVQLAKDLSPASVHPGQQRTHRLLPLRRLASHLRVAAVPDARISANISIKRWQNSSSVTFDADLRRKPKLRSSLRMAVRSS